MRSINDAGLDILKEFEAGPQGNRQPALTTYFCPAGKMTIGWGHTIGVTPGMMITPAQADEFLVDDLADSCAVVEKAVEGVPTTDNEFAAMVLLAFNVGAGGFLGSTVLRLHKAGKKTDAAAAFAMWRKMTDPSTGQLVDSPGLIRRRSMEAALYLKAEFQQPAMPQEVEPPKSIVTSKTVIAGVTGVLTGAGSIVDNAGSIKDVVDNVTAATASMASLKASLGAIASGKGLGAIFAIVSVACIATVVGRYVLKARKGDVTVR
jgi:lysozyme